MTSNWPPAFSSPKVSSNAASRFFPSKKMCREKTAAIWCARIWPRTPCRIWKISGGTFSRPPVAVYAARLPSIRCARAPCGRPIPISGSAPKFSCQASGEAARIAGGVWPHRRASRRGALRRHWKVAGIARRYRPAQCRRQSHRLGAARRQAAFGGFGFACERAWRI